MCGDFQHFKGYSLFLYKDHVVELFDLDENTRAKHLQEMTLVAEAVKNAFGAEKMNYECLGKLKFNWDCIITTAGRALSQGIDVLIDYVIEDELPRVRELASLHDASLYYIVLTATEDELERRIRNRGV